MYRTSSHYGWVPDLPDFRDFAFTAKQSLIQQLPKSVDLRENCPPVYDQEQLGSCTANAIGAAFQFDLIKQNAPDFVPSRLFIYYNERSIENTINVDSGAQIRDGIKSIARLGVCRESMWPYTISEFAHKPYLECYQDALKHQAVSYQRIARDLNQIKACLADGYPVVVGFAVYEYFESEVMTRMGVLSMPEQEERLVGGHAVLVVGYDDALGVYIVRNSWGTEWGQGGYFTMPYAYLLDPNLADDFWTIRLVTGNALPENAVGADGGNPAASVTDENRNRGTGNAGTAMVAAEALQTATLHVTFSNVDPGLSTLTARCNRISYTIHQTDRIVFDNVGRGDVIIINGATAGSTSITVTGVQADPQQMNYALNDPIQRRITIL